MDLKNLVLIFSSASFLFYGISYFISKKMKSEFKRFGLEKFGIITAILEIMGGVGLVIGLKFNSILVISSGGLGLLMFLGILVRIKVKDSILITIPALFYMLLNLYILYKNISID